MHPGEQRLWKTIKGGALGATAAALVVCIRLAMASHGTATPPPGAGRSMERDFAEDDDITSLLRTGSGGRLERWM
ncbi:MAG: hypothetical protein EOP87_17275, partial [Verrucomicrobiaceae bacterium]